MWEHKFWTPESPISQPMNDFDLLIYSRFSSFFHPAPLRLFFTVEGTRFFFQGTSIRKPILEKKTFFHSIRSLIFRQKFCIVINAPIKRKHHFDGFTEFIRKKKPINNLIFEEIINLGPPTFLLDQFKACRLRPNAATDYFRPKLSPPPPQKGSLPKSARSFRRIEEAKRLHN